MIDHVDHAELPHVVRSLTDFIERNADEYTNPGIAGFLESPRSALTRPTERELLSEFHSRVEQLVIEYAAAVVPPRGDELIFAHVYHVAEPLADNDQEIQREIDDKLDTERKVLAALLAAETEFRGPRRLSGTQSTRLAGIYEMLGHILVREELPAHAALAFKRATSLFGANEDFDAQDSCRLSRARAKRLATFPVWRRTPGYVSDLLCGYGFRPFRMLVWIGVQLALFTGVLWQVEHEHFSTALHMSLINYLNPVGLGDLADIGTAGRVVLIIEAWTGAVSMSVFFALLVRKWFRF
ncbi:potassium channel family protein [Nocardia arizonensis]|uniref:potassium channel family protein n=1 Tax=Nocardia arizonensis TaxID=1141647 RepID=UPI0006D00D1C|nr:potassium channel family protein [Nocardia arizonensis]